MKQFILFLAVAVAFCTAADEDDEPFSIGLGVLSPSYSQTVGKENVKVKFDQKEDGRFSFSIGDPKTGSNQYLRFGPSADSQQKPATSERSSGYHSPALAAGYQAPASDYQQSGYQSSSYQPSSSGFQGAPLAAGYQPPSYGYSGPSSNSYDQPSGFYRSEPSSGYFGSGSSGKPESDMSGILPSGFSYHATEGQAFLRDSGELRKPQQEQIMPAGFSYHATEGQAFLRGRGELRKPEGQIMPAGFSYHATEGQSFLRQGDSPNFAIAEEKQSRGPAEESFYKNFASSSNPRQGGPYLKNGLVGYGPGGPSRKLPIGGYAGKEFQGAHEEHGGHEA
ncbi:hypothetical protein JTE90_021958 [Oedothorax gibbosus]|uniref:Uncharacterized protein n=1 Tax=Oedothorax gibbosus TaxID=931172 RepID=A0AAV6V404_9ARAC|nr:hypothetical protein JTE90_021958 [Oedothorax gibbosus]